MNCMLRVLDWRIGFRGLKRVYATAVIRDAAPAEDGIGRVVFFFPAAVFAREVRTAPTLVDVVYSPKPKAKRP